MGKLIHPSASIGDVAREAGVSKSTVSNYLNDRSSRLSESTRQRIAQVVERLGYRPMLGARRLSNRSRSGTVGLLVRRGLADAFVDSYFALAMAGVGPALAGRSIRSLVLTSPDAGRDDIDYVLSLANGIVDGFLVFDLGDPDPTLEALVKHHIPFVAVGQPDPQAPFPWVASDHAGAVHQAVAWLAARGHTKIALEDDEAALWLHRHRRRGYLEALSSLSLPADPTGPTAILRSLSRHLSSPQTSGAEVVLLDGRTQSGGGWIEAPSQLVGQRAALILDDSIEGNEVAPELLPATFHLPSQTTDRSLP